MKKFKISDKTKKIIIVILGTALSVISAKYPVISDAVNQIQAILGI